MYEDTSRRPRRDLDPTEYLVDPTGVVFHTLEEFEDPLFITNKRSDIYLCGVSGYQHTRASSFMARVFPVSSKAQPDKPDLLNKLFKGSIQSAFDEYIQWVLQRTGHPTHRHHMVISQPALESKEWGNKGGPLLVKTAQVGFFSVPREVHVRLYGRTVEIPQATFILHENEELTDTDVDNVLSDSVVDAVVGPTFAKTELDKERKVLTNELLGFAVDLFKAGSGHYDGEAAQTLRNLVTERFKEIHVDIPTHVDKTALKNWQEIFLTKALVRITDLGRFVLPEGKRGYFEKRAIEKVGKMKADLGIRDCKMPSMPVVRNTETPITTPVMDDKPKANLSDEAAKARARILRNQKEETEPFTDYDGVLTPKQQEMVDRVGDMEGMWETEDEDGPAPEIKVDRPDGL